MGKGAGIPEADKAPMLLPSFKPSNKLEVTAATLRTKDVKEHTRDYIAATLINEYSAKHINMAKSKQCFREKRVGSPKSIRQLHVSQLAKSDPDVSSTLRSAAKVFAAALNVSKVSSSKRIATCRDFRERPGHTQDLCNINLRNPNNHISPVTGKKSFHLH